MRSLTRHSFRFSAVLMALLWLALPVLAAAHGTHEHRYCPEHQTVEEVRGNGGDVAAADSEGWNAVDASAEAEDHESCLLAAVEFRGATEPPVASLELAVPPQSPAPVAESRSVARTVDVLAHAPKASPPAV